METKPDAALEMALSGRKRSYTAALAAVTALFAALGSLATSIYEVAGMRRQDVKQDALLSSVVAVQTVQIGRLQAEVRALQEESRTVHTLLQVLAGGRRSEDAPVVRPDGTRVRMSVAAVPGAPAPSAKAAPPSDLPGLAEMREQAKRGNVWRPDGTWAGVEAR